MKFCSKCGHELVDEAVVCVSCGRLVEQIIKQEPAEKIKEPVVYNGDCESNTGINKCANIFSFIYSLAIAFTCGFAILSAQLGDISIYTAYYSGNYGYYYLNEDLAITSFLFGCIAFICGVAGFVFTLIGKQRGSKLLSSISRLIIGIFALISIIVALSY